MSFSIYCCTFKKKGKSSALFTMTRDIRRASVSFIRLHLVSGGGSLLFPGAAQGDLTGHVARVKQGFQLQVVIVIVIVIVQVLFLLLRVQEGLELVDGVNQDVELLLPQL